PTIFSLSLFRNPASCDVIVDTISVSISSTPPFSLSSFVNSMTCSQRSNVSLVGPSRNASSPTQGVKLFIIKSATSHDEGQFPYLNTNQATFHMKINYTHI